MTSLVVTTISPPTKILRLLASGAEQVNIPFIIIGDATSPQDFGISGSQFYNIAEQENTGFDYARVVPENHYARKNIGYLIAIENGSQVIIETDDDNIPRNEFWNMRKPEHEVDVITKQGWFNVYSLFTSEDIWPRGFPLEKFTDPNKVEIINKKIYCPIQQGLADENPDVDAVYRMTSKLPIHFNQGRIGLGKGTWCPFNSQNTTFFEDSFPLMYLPATCSFRMTDIWRSFVAQRIGWENDWYLLFHEATVWQERNPHNLLKDFEQEIPGYLNNYRLCAELEMLDIRSGKKYIADNMILCYRKMIEMQLLDPVELNFLDVWLNDLSKIHSL
jgi:hypothetical protein